jgi:hypothetical protein
MLITLTDTQAAVVLGAMRSVASAHNTKSLSAADRSALAGFHHVILRLDGTLDVEALPAPTPAQLALAVGNHDARTHVVQFLIVMALVDGTVDNAKIALVVEYARALDVREDAVRQLAELGHGNLAWLRADVARQNLLSITGKVLNESIQEWILPYRGERAEPVLAERYRALSGLPEGTLGRTFIEFYRANQFALPGEPDGLNHRFASPHDTTHLLSGYDTSPQGELLVSTFTAGMHQREPMSGHILPVILSWHLGIEFAKLPGKITGQLDPQKFWVAWDRGSQVTTDVFDDAWSLWDAAPVTLQVLRDRYKVPPLDPAYAAHGDVPAWYHPVA